MFACKPLSSSILKMDVKEYKWRKELIELEHKCKIDWAKFIRHTEKLKHEMELERERIKSAEIRKSQMRRDGGGFKW